MTLVNEHAGRALVACSRLVDFAGAEITSLEIAQALRELGFEVTIAALEIGAPFSAELEASGFQIVELAKGIPEEQYDLLWLNHNVTAYDLLCRHAVRSTIAVFSSLSHFEPLEVPPIGHLRFSEYLLNSAENLHFFSERYPEFSDRAHVLPNSAPSAFFDRFDHTRARALRRIGIVSNHVPAELMEAAALLREQGLEVDVIGLQGKPRRVTPEVVTSYDAIVTIGKTVQYSLAAGVPVFCYDRFGGPGWITTDNFDTAAAKNFSGRCTPVALSAGRLTDSIRSGFEAAYQQRDALRDIARARFDLRENVATVIRRAAANEFTTSLSDTDRASLSAVPEVFVRMREVIANGNYLASLLREQAGAREAHVSRLAAELNDRDSSIASLTQRASELQRELDRRQGSIEAMSTELAQSRARAAALRAEQSDLRARFAKIEDALNERIDAMHHSTSWRVTSPLRLMSAIAAELRSTGLSRARWLGVAARRSGEIVRKEGLGVFVDKARTQLGRARARRAGNGEGLGAAIWRRASGAGRGQSGPLVSFVIPIYDRTDALRVAINSALNQTYRNIEVILVTDGSPPETIDVVNEFRYDRRVKIFNYPTSSGNAVRGRNKGIKEADGEYIAFLDSDDIAAPDRLERSLPLLKAGEADVVYGAWRAMLDGTREIDGLTNGQVLYSPDSDLELLKKVCVPCQSTVTVRRDLLLRAGFLKPRMKYREDHELWARLAYFGGQFKAVQHPLVDLRLHAGNNELNFKGNDEHWETLLQQEYTQAAALPKKVVFLVAGVGVSGGIMVVLKYANYLMSIGHDVLLVNVGSPGSLDWAGTNRVPVVHIDDKRRYLLDKIDLLFATFWMTCDWMQRISAARKLYFVQSDERLFYDDPELKEKVAKTYSLPFELVAIAGWIQDFLKRDFSRDAVLIPNGLDTSFFKPVAPLAPKNPQRPRVLIEGPISVEFKGVADAYAAVAPLDCEIWIVSVEGKPEPDWRVDRFFGRVQFDDMPRLYSSCDVLLKMSRVESFSYPPLEAMACECAVVVGKVAGAMEYIVDGENALVVEQRDIEGAREAVRRLLEDQELRARLLRGGRETASHWDWERSFEAMRRVVEDNPAGFQ
jgi:glycosyltransferase involved in cell wall biosynthesis